MYRATLDLEKKKNGNGKISVDFRTVKLKPKKSKLLRVVSLFSGCGGLDLGFLGGFKFRNKEFARTNFRIELANDIDKDAKLVYAANSTYFGDHDFVCGDVKNLKSEEVPEFDFLIGGFPCQPFSNAGLRKGVDDERGTLFEECQRLLRVGSKKKAKPMGFVFENVKGIMSTKMPDGTSVPDEIVRITEKLGYRTNYKLLKTSDYGVPTNRQRVIIVGLRKEFGYFDFSHMDEVVKETSLPNEKGNPYDLLLGSILSDIPKNAPQRLEYWKYSPGGQYMVDKIGPCADGVAALKKFKKRVPLQKISDTITVGRSWKSMDPADMSMRFRKIWYNPQKYRAPNFYRRFALGEINGTITASAQPENCGITHPFENRRFTIREIARIQSFPDDFDFPSTSIANAYKVIGNAVPPVFGWVIAKALEKHLKNA